MNSRHTSTAGHDRRQRRVSNLLLDRSFQLKYVGMTLALSVTISFALGVFLVEQMTENSRILQLDAELDSVFAQQLAATDTQNIAVLVGALFLFNLILVLGAILVTHRLAGPIFVFRRYLRILADGRIPQMRALRRGDEFSELLDALRSTVDAIERGFREDLAFSARLRQALDEGSDLEAIRDELTRFEERRHQSLGDESSS